MAGKPGRSGRKSQATKDAEEKARNAAAFEPITNIQPPDYLDSYGSQKWAELIEPFCQNDLMTDVDRDALGAYCEAYSEFRRADDGLAQTGLTIVSEKGGMYQNPLVGIKNKALERMRFLYKEFGLTPKARSLMKLPTAPKKKDEESEGFATLLKMRRNTA